MEPDILPDRLTGTSLGRRALIVCSGAIALLLLSPILWLLARALDIGDAVPGILTRPSTLEVLFNSVLLTVVVTGASVALGVPLAVLTTRTNLPFRRAWTVLIALPLVVPSYIGAFAFVSAFGPRGALSELLAPLGIERLPTIYGFHGAALVLTLFVYPYVFLTARAALLSMDTTLVEAARTLDHSTLAAFRRVTLPQIRPAVTAGALLVALYTLSDFGTPAIMHFDAFTRVIFVEYNAFGRDVAAVLSLELLGVTAVILALESRVGRRSGYATRGTRTEESRLALGRLRGPALLCCGAVVTLTLIVPVGVLFLWLTRSGPGYAGGGFAFQWTYGWNSVAVSAVAALLAAVLALPVAYAAARTDSRAARVFERATYVGYAAPGIVLGLALVYAGVRYVPMLYQTLVLLVFAYVVRFLPQAVGATRSSILQVDRRLIDASRSLGDTALGGFRRVTLPLIAPGVIAGAALVFLTTMKELPATLLLHPTGFKTLVTYIWQVQSAGYYGQAAVPALVLVGVSACSMLVLLSREAIQRD